MKPKYKRKHETFQLMGSDIKTDTSSMFHSAFSGAKKELNMSRGEDLVVNDWRFHLPKRNMEEAKNKRQASQKHLRKEV